MVRRPLTALPGDLQSCCNHATSYSVCWAAAVAGRIPAERGENGRWTYDQGDLPRIAAALDRWAQGGVGPKTARAHAMSIGDAAPSPRRQRATHANAARTAQPKDDTWPKSVGIASGSLTEQPGPQRGTLVPITQTIPVAGKMYGVSRSAIYRGAAAGSIVLLKLGRTTLVDMESLRKFVEALPRATIRR